MDQPESSSCRQELGEGRLLGHAEDLRSVSADRSLEAPERVANVGGQLATALVEGPLIETTPMIPGGGFRHVRAGAIDFFKLVLPGHRLIGGGKDQDSAVTIAHDVLRLGELEQVQRPV